MDHSASHSSYLLTILVFCVAAVVAVPLFHRLRLGAVIGYLAAGIVIGPSVLKLVADPATVLGIAELGVVLLLFIIGLELRISHLLSLRRDIFGLGALQVGVTTVALGGIAALAGLQWNAAVAVGFALSLSATALALQQLEEWQDRQTRYAERTFSVLIFQDLAVVPALALIPLLSGVADGIEGWASVVAAGKAIGAVAVLVLAGRYLLNPAFRLLASSGAREVMTAAALLIVLGSALLMQVAGMSMAMGAFLAGLLLAESNFKHQLEADIEPFRGILLGLFFMSVGMSLDLALVARQWPLLLGAAIGVMALKVGIAALLARMARSPRGDSLFIGTLLAPAGEFTFVLVPLALGVGILSGPQSQFLTAVAVLTMLFGPILARVVHAQVLRIRSRRAADEKEAPAAADFDGAGGRVLVVGFGRFGQVLNQVLLAQGVDVTVIDNDIDQIRSAARFGFRVFYGDGGRLDVLRAAGAAEAEVICVCVDNRDTATRIVDLVHAEFPNARTHVRAYDRIHAIALMEREVDFHVRETFDSALAFGRATLRALGTPDDAAGGIVEDVRRRDVARLVMQREQGLMGGATLLHGTRVKPEPLVTPKQTTKALTDETQAIIRAGDE